MENFKTVVSIFSLDKTDVDERLNKDLADYVMMRIMQSPIIQTNITPISLKPEIFQPESR